MSKYTEKRYGKRTFILVAVGLVVFAAACIFGGIYAVNNMAHWSKYILVVLGSAIGLFFGAVGIFMLAMSPSMISQEQSVKDGNRMKGVADVRLCDKCGREVSPSAEFCEHCGEKQETGMGMKVCPKCDAKNSGTADFCEKCGSKFE